MDEFDDDPENASSIFNKRSRDWGEGKNVDDFDDHAGDASSVFKKRSREEKAWDDAFRDKLSSSITRVVTYPEDVDDNDNFVSSLLGEGNDTITTSNFPRQATLEVATWHQQSPKLDSNACNSAALFLENHPGAYDLAMLQTAKAVPAPEPSAMLFEHSTNDANLKMPAAEAPSIMIETGKIKSAPPTMFVERWTCDVCKAYSFETFDEAQSHEMQCQIIHDAINESDEQPKAQMFETANALTSFACRPPPQNEDSEEHADDHMIPAKRHPSIDLVPQGGDIHVLSDYNNLLVHHVEFYYPSSDNRVGLRCIHCKDHPQHVPAATFFPSTIGSISSGLGTIGARHFCWGKCPFVQSDVVQQMIETKKTSNLQTRTNGRVGLDSYCKKIAKKFGITDDVNSGICWELGTVANFDLVDHDIMRSHESVTSSFNECADSNGIASILLKMKDDDGWNSHAAEETTTTMPSFIPSETQYFWECHGCMSIPFEYRAKGSVVHSVGEPPREKVEGHLQHCTGEKPLAIPRSATIQPYYGEGVPVIKIKWGGEHSGESNSRRRSKSTLNAVKAGVEDGQLCFPNDQQYTTDFAFFVVSQLKKCYLTKAGGSRGACPVGFAGLACTHCAGSPTERRFFYTSADHLRNSFSHIPTHLGECSTCPADVKVRLEELKMTRNRQKSNLKVGYHKLFIGRVWERLHNNSDQTSDTEEDPATSLQIPAPSQQKSVYTALVQDSENASTSDLTYHTLLQVEPYQTEPSAAFEEDEESSREIGFPGLICRHCMKFPDGRKFFTNAAEHLGDLLLTIANHVCSCNECPSDVKARIARCMITHERQLDERSEEHDMCMNRVWQRMTEASKIPARKAPPKAPHARMKSDCPTTSTIVTANDARLVTDFTLFTMQQVRPCKLDNCTSGSRGFDHGFPGLECIWCSGESNSRRFFYRTAEILAGNYAHIPNHLMSCTRVPEEIKRQLSEKREAHQMLKHSLPKGSQKQFFEAIWERLHSRISL